MAATRRGVSVRLEGGPRLQATLQATADGLADLSDANQATGDIVVTAARLRVPRRSGRLAVTLRATGEPDAAVVEAGGPGVPYAGVQEYGWPARHIPAQPYLTTSAVDTTPAWLAVHQRTLQGRLAKVKGA